MERSWSELFWCPPNLRWSDFNSNSAKFNDLYYSFLTAGALMILRYVTEKALFRPLAKTMCFGSRPLDKTGGDDNKTRPPHSRTIYKFSESMWRFSFYLLASIYGWFFVLWDKPYLRDTMHTLYNHQDHPVKPEEWWYYNVELGFYISLLITQFIDTRRSDFWQMFVHHIVTITLLVLSWGCNFHRIGALVLAIHDVADVPMEGAKLAKYCKKQRLADLLFAIFTITWIYTRCYLLPTRVIYYTSWKALSIIQIFHGYYIFNGLLCLLQMLHVAWTWVIIKIVFYALQNDGMRDLRSDSEDLHDD